MYASTAAICVAIDKLSRFPRNQEDPLLIDARSELITAQNLLESRWKIWNSIFWKRSNSAIKRSTRARLEGLAFDALTGVINAGELLNRHLEQFSIVDENALLWSEIIGSLHNAYRWLLESYCDDCLYKQLKLPIVLESS